MRVFGSDQTTWATAPMSGMPGKDGDVRLFVEDDQYFDLGSPSSNATTVDAEGNEVDTSREVDPPTAPPATVGDVIPLDPAAESDAEAGAEAFEIATPDATYRIDRAGLREYAGPVSDPVGPPDGGSLVALSVTRESKANAPTSPVSSAVIRAGGTGHEIPEGYSAIAVDGDGSDAVVAVEYDGNVQEFSVTSGELVAGHPYVSTAFTAVNTPQGETIGERDGASTDMKHKVRTSIVSWDEERGWAAEGMDRAYIAFSLATETEFGQNTDRVDYDERSYTVTDMSITADGEDVAVDPSSITLEPRADTNFEDLDVVALIVVDVPIGTKEIVVDGTVDLTATIKDNDITQYQRKHIEGEPESIQHTLDLDPVTMTSEN